MPQHWAAAAAAKSATCGEITFQVVVQFGLLGRYHSPPCFEHDLMVIYQNGSEKKKSKTVCTRRKSMYSFLNVEGFFSPRGWKLLNNSNLQQVIEIKWMRKERVTKTKHNPPPQNSPNLFFRSSIFFLNESQNFEKFICCFVLLMSGFFPPFTASGNDIYFLQLQFQISNTDWKEHCILPISSMMWRN